MGLTLTGLEQGGDLTLGQGRGEGASGYSGDKGRHGKDLSTEKAEMETVKMRDVISE